MQNWVIANHVGIIYALRFIYSYGDYEVPEEVRKGSKLIEVLAIPSNVIQILDCFFSNREDITSMINRIILTSPKPKEKVQLLLFIRDTNDEYPEWVLNEI